MTAISVVMGVYNGGNTLAATLDSILAQTERDFELIAVDDGSTDATPQLLAGYAARDARVRVLTQANQGLTRALIAGCAAARGTYIARHDAGDLSHPERFARQKDALDRDPALVFVSCETQYAGPELEPLYVVSGGAARGTAIEILDARREHGVVDGPTHHGSVMMRRDAYVAAGGYRAAFRYGQDWDLWYRLASLGTFTIVPAVLYTARLEPRSISGANRGAQQQLARLSVAAFRAAQRGEPDAPILARAAAVRGGRAGRRDVARGLYFIAEALRRNRDLRARRYFAAAVRTCPLPRIVLGWLRAALTLHG